MEVVVTIGAIRRAKLQSNRHHRQTNTQLFTDRCPFLSPNQLGQSSEGKISHLCSTSGGVMCSGFFLKTGLFALTLLRALPDPAKASTWFCWCWKSNPIIDHRLHTVCSFEQSNVLSFIVLVVFERHVATDCVYCAHSFSICSCVPEVGGLV